MVSADVSAMMGIDIGSGRFLLAIASRGLFRNHDLSLEIHRDARGIATKHSRAVAAIAGYAQHIARGRESA